MCGTLGCSPSLLQTCAQTLLLPSVQVLCSAAENKLGTDTPKRQRTYAEKGSPSATAARSGKGSVLARTTTRACSRVQQVNVVKGCGDNLEGLTWSQAYKLMMTYTSWLNCQS